jgi:hypothetical protein
MAQGPHERALTVAHISRDHRRPGEIAQLRQEVGRQIRRSGVHPRDLPSSIDTVIVKVGLPECLDLREEVRKQRLALVHDQESPKPTNGESTATAPARPPAISTRIAHAARGPPA